MQTITLGLGLNPKFPPRLNELSLTTGNFCSSGKMVSPAVPTSSASSVENFFSSKRRGPRCRHLMGFIELGVPVSGVFRASQAVELFPSVCPEVVVREARVEDCWEVAETHCSSFFPNYAFPYDLLLRVNRLVGLLAGFSVPDGCMRTCLVAVVGNSFGDSLYFGSDDIKIGELEGKISFNKGCVAGILTIDTLADFLPRKGPLMKRRTGIAYISNVAVREKDRRKGIAKKLITKAEAEALKWGCRAIALHCDARNPAATRLYLGQGFKCIKVPEGAKWPQPKISPGIQFNFMMKLLKSRNSNITTP